MTATIKIIAVISLLWAQTCPALEVRSHPTPGGIVQISFLPADQPKPTVFFADRSILVVERKGYWEAVVGLGLQTQPGEYFLDTNLNERKLRFNVAAREYPIQALNFSDPRLVTPNAADELRIERETHHLHNLLSTFSSRLAPRQLALPLKGRQSSPFGVRRMLNGLMRQPHTGLDIAAAQGSQIISAAEGDVVLVDDLFFTGNTVVINHGQGMFTLYGHLQNAIVEDGQQVAAGEPIGTVGATGRATGPHLHWSVSLNGEWVDPALFLPITR